MKKGFTLIELLAVIIILAIILVIVVPSVTKIIDNSKYSSFKNDEQMIAKAAKLYLFTNSSLLPSNIGDKTAITYSTLKDTNYLSNLVDPISKNDCTNSSVFVEKISDTDYKYTPALICDNYISLDTFDMLNGSGKFETDINGDGLTDGWNMYQYPTAEGSYTKSISNNRQTATRIGGVNSSAYLYMNKQINSIIPNNKYYAYVEFEDLSSSNYKLQLCIDNYNPDYTNATSIPYSSNATSGSLSLIHLPRADTTYIILFLRLYAKITPAGDGTVKWKNAILINLTEMYGAGNEPTKDKMDSIIENVKYIKN